MRTALIGHRGTGKTQLLKRIEGYFADAMRKVLCLDLDSEIERRSGQKVQQIFSEQGEAAFRKLEREIFSELDSETASSKSEVFLALGAGFSPELIPSSWRVLWVRRTSDESGRIFTDRPRLDEDVTALTEYRGRFAQRQEPFRARADETLWLDEGLDSADPTEREYFLDGLKNLGGALTLRSTHFRNSLESFLRARLAWGVQWFELRDDLLSVEQIERVLRILPDQQILLSFRDPSREKETRDLIERHGIAFDWPLERGECLWGEPRFLSLHERLSGQSIAEALARFPLAVPEGCQLKAALPIPSFQELADADRWAESRERVFLPLSRDGRWAWYRLLKSADSRLGFFREDEGSGADQPTLLQWARQVRLRGERSFAAVLGDPVAHSRTPLEQYEFFASKQIPVYAIRVTKEEWAGGALEVLRTLGLKYAAVTAPLKEQAFAVCTVLDEKALAFKAVNTLFWRDESWHGTNTDLEGFQSLAQSLESPSAVAVWGGGGTLGILRRVLPDAQFFSVRTRENRSEAGARALEFRPETLIWAAGAASEPPPEWMPRQVVDLSYTESSPAREFALSRGAQYISGLEMFRTQAAEQRRFWENVSGGAR